MLDKIKNLFKKDSVEKWCIGDKVVLKNDNHSVFYPSTIVKIVGSKFIIEKHNLNLIEVTASDITINNTYQQRVDDATTKILKNKYNL